MLSRARRIPREDFKEILTHGRRYNSPHLLLYVLQMEKNSESKFSFSVSKKVAKHATDRNKFRRRGYSGVQSYLKNIKPGFFCFFSFKKDSQKMSFAELKSEILDLLHSANMIG